MKSAFPTSVAVVLFGFSAAASIAACSDDATPVSPAPDGGSVAEASAPDTSVPEAAAPIEAGPKLVTYTGTVHGFDPAKDLANQPPLADANVCVASVQPESCVKTNALGRYVLRLPANDKKLRLTFSAPGYMPAQYVTFTTEQDDTNDRMILPSDATAQSFWSKCGASYPDTTGAVFIQGYRRTGASTYTFLDGAAMTPSAGVGPCYMATPFAHDAQQTTTKTAGLGGAVIANVPTGASTVDVTISLAGTVCYSNEHLVDGPTPNVVRVPVRPGFLTAVEVICE